MAGPEKVTTLNEVKNTLGNKKLDTQEIKYLKSQKELLLNWKDVSTKQLLEDIKSANISLLSQNTKGNTMLNSFLTPTGMKYFLPALAQKAGWTNIFDTLMKEQNPINKKIIILKALLLAQKGVVGMKKESTQLAIKTGNFVDFKSGINMDPAFDVRFVYNIHKFQKEISNNPRGADCLITDDLIQQLIANTGIKLTLTQNINEKFSRSEQTEKDTYLYAKDVLIQTTEIMKDPNKNSMQKISSLLEVINKTVPEKKNSAISIIQEHFNRIYLGSDVKTQGIILQTIEKELPGRKDIVQGVEHSGEVREKNEAKFHLIETTAETWLKYLESQIGENDMQEMKIKGQTKPLKAMIEDAISVLKKAKTSTKEISKEVLAKQLDNIFFTTYVGKYGRESSSGSGKWPEGHNNQLKILGDIKNTLLNSDYSDPKKIQISVLENIVKIDKNFDGIINRSYESSESLIKQVEDSGDLLKSKISNPENNQEISKFNVDMSKVDNFFQKLETKDPSASKLFNALMVNISKSDTKISTQSAGMYTTMSSEFVIDPGLIINFKEAFGFDPKYVDRKNFKEQINEIRKIQSEIKKETEHQIKGSLTVQKDQMINEIEVFKLQKGGKISSEDSIVIDSYEDAIEQINTVLSGSKIPDPLLKSITQSMKINQTPGMTIEDVSVIYSRKMGADYAIKTFRSLVTKEVVEHNAGAINILKDRKASGKTLSVSERTIDFYADRIGAGKYISDETYKYAVAVTKEVLVQVAIALVSAGVANLLEGLIIKGITTAIESGKLGATAITALAKLGPHTIENAGHGIIAALSHAHKGEKLAAATVALGRGLVQGGIYHYAHAVVGAVAQKTDMISNQFEQHHASLSGSILSYMGAHEAATLLSLGVASLKTHDAVQGIKASMATKDVVSGALHMEDGGSFKTILASVDASMRWQEISKNPEFNTIKEKIRLNPSSITSEEREKINKIAIPKDKIFGQKIPMPDKLEINKQIYSIKTNSPTETIAVEDLKIRLEKSITQAEIDNKTQNTVLYI